MIASASEFVEQMRRFFDDMAFGELPDDTVRAYVFCGQADVILNVL